MIRKLLCVLAAVLFVSSLAWAPNPALGQGVLVNVDPAVQVVLPRPTVIIYPPHPHPIIVQPAPQPESTYKIKELAVNATLSEQVARVQVSQSFVNTGSRQMEACFVFPLPYDGAVDQLTLLIDGKEHPARLLPAEEARKIYEDIVRKNRDPALLEWTGTGMFKTSVFPVPPGAERKVTLRYSQLCRKFSGLTDFLFPLSTAKYTSHPVESVTIQLAIDGQTDIKNVYSPSHSVEIKCADNKHATVSYSSKNEVPTSDFRLLYDVGAGQVGASVLSYRPKTDDDGYFILLASPEIKPAGGEEPKKTVLFVVDRSGSMSGEKIEQAKNAAKFVINNLKPGDLFNVIAYDSEVQSWRPELQLYNDENRQNALGFIEGLYAGGSTNIDGALDAALGQLKDGSRPNFVVFLTDGLPTVGETNEMKIVDSAKEQNKVRARVFAFGVGYDVNARLLDKLVRTNFGQSEYVRPNENIEEKVAKFYQRIGSPVMSDLAIKFDVEGLTTADGEAVNRYYPKEAHDLFAGEQLVVVGRYKRPGAAKVKVSGSVSGNQQTFDFPATLVEKSADESSAFIEKLWAIRRVGEIIDEMDLKGKNDELIKELVGLSTTHGILTPYTSFLADENTNLADLARNVELCEDRVELLATTEGQVGVVQRQSKGALQRAYNPAEEASAVEELMEAEAAFRSAGAMPAADASGPAPAVAGRQSSRGAYGGGYGGAAPGSGLPAIAATPTYSWQSASGDKAEEKAKLAQAVKKVGRKAFYRRGEQWIDSAVTEEQERRTVKIERFSKEYFELIDKHGKDVAKYLAFDDPVVLEIDGQCYSF